MDKAKGEGRKAKVCPKLYGFELKILKPRRRRGLTFAPLLLPFSFPPSEVL